MGVACSSSNISDTELPLTPLPYRFPWQLSSDSLLRDSCEANDVASTKRNAIIEHVGTVSDDGETALMAAARRGNIECCRALLATPEVGLSDFHTGATALMCAARTGHSDVVSLLAPYEARICAFSGLTALMVACHAGHYECARVLAGYEAGMTDVAGNTALIYAAAGGRADICRLLVGCELGRTNVHGLCALATAVARGYYHTEVHDVLRSEESLIAVPFITLAVNGILDPAHDNGSLSPRRPPGEAGDAAAAAAAAAGPGLAAIVGAVRSRPPAAPPGSVARLLAPPENVTSADALGRTALMEAASIGHQPWVVALAAAHSGLAAKRADAEGRTALMHAARGGHVECVLELIPLEVGLTDSAGRRALDHVVEGIVEALAAGDSALVPRIRECGRALFVFEAHLQPETMLKVVSALDGLTPDGRFGPGLKGWVGGTELGRVRSHTHLATVSTASLKVARKKKSHGKRKTHRTPAPAPEVEAAPAPVPLSMMHLNLPSERLPDLEIYTPSTKTLLSLVGRSGSGHETAFWTAVRCHAPSAATAIYRAAKAHHDPEVFETECLLGKKKGDRVFAAAAAGDLAFITEWKAGRRALGATGAAVPEGGLYDVRDTAGRTALIWAAIAGQRKAVQALAAEQAGCMDKTGATALYYAVLAGDLVVARHLAREAGVRAPSGLTTLGALVAMPTIPSTLSAALPALCKHGSAPGSGGVTPLMVALDNGNLEVASMLAQADPGACRVRDNNGRTALQRFILSIGPTIPPVGSAGLPRGVAQALLPPALLPLAAIGVGATDTRGATALWVAAESGRMGVARQLLDLFGADEAAAPDLGRTVLMAASVLLDGPRVADLAESMRGGLGQTDNDGLTALAHAVKLGRPVPACVLDAEATINCRLAPPVRPGTVAGRRPSTASAPRPGTAPSARPGDRPRTASARGAMPLAAATAAAAPATLSPRYADELAVGGRLNQLLRDVRGLENLNLDAPCLLSEELDGGIAVRASSVEVIRNAAEAVAASILSSAPVTHDLCTEPTPTPSLSGLLPGVSPSPVSSPRARVPLSVQPPATTTELLDDSMQDVNTVGELSDEPETEPEYEYEYEVSYEYDYEYAEFSEMVSVE